MSQIRLQTDEVRSIRDRMIDLNWRQFDISNKLNDSYVGSLQTLWSGEVAEAFGLRLGDTVKHTSAITDMINKYTEALDFAIIELEEADRRAAEQQAKEEAAKNAAAAGAGVGAGYAAVQVGQQISRNSDAYSSGGGNPFERGQCTWYVWGRVKEITGKDANFRQSWGRHAKNWPSLISNSIKRSVPERGSLMIDTSGTYGHVAVVESVEKLPNGDYKILFSESNWDNAVYSENPATDGKVKEILLSKIGTRGFDTFLEIT